MFDTMRRRPLLGILLAAACGTPSTVLATVDLGETRSAFIYTEASATPESQVTDRTDAPAGFLTFTPAPIDSESGSSTSNASQRVEILLDSQNGVAAVHSSA